MPTYVIPIGIISIIGGFSLVWSSISALVNIQYEWRIYRRLKTEILREPTLIEQPSRLKTALIYIWHYSGYGLTAFGAGLIGAQVIGPLL